jgi:chloramphenicol 3-O-phosphotransferase
MEIKSYIFTVAIRGVGETEEEALTDAIEAVNDQGGIHPDSVLEAREE